MSSSRNVCLGGCHCPTNQFILNWTYIWMKCFICAEINFRLAIHEREREEERRRRAKLARQSSVSWEKWNYIHLARGKGFIARSSQMNEFKIYTYLIVKKGAFHQMQIYMTLVLISNQIHMDQGLIYEWQSYFAN